MPPEDYERIKAAEKDHLRALRTLKQTLRQARRRRASSEALGEIARAPERLGECDALTDRLAAETARNEARLDLALGVRATEAPSSQDAPARSATRERASDDALRQERARALLRQLKAEVASEAAPPSSDAAKSTAPEHAKAPPQKTIGRMPGSSEDAS